MFFELTGEEQNNASIGELGRLDVRLKERCNGVETDSAPYYASGYTSKGGPLLMARAGIERRPCPTLV